MTLKDATTGVVQLLTDLVITCIRFGLLILLYKYLFEFKGGTINGETLQTIAWSMAMYFVFLAINPSSVGKYIQAQVKSGQVQDWLAKPINYILFLFGSYFGRRIHIFIVNAIFVFASMYFIFGLTPNMHTYTFWLTSIPVFVFCLFLSFLIFVSLGFLAFWIEDISSIQWIVDKSIMVLGGSYLPVAFFPPLLKNLAVWSPFGASQFLTSTVYSSWGENWLKFMSIQIFWISIFAVILFFLYKKAIRNVATNGG